MELTDERKSILHEHFKLRLGDPGYVADLNTEGLALLWLEEVSGITRQEYCEAVSYSGHDDTIRDEMSSKVEAWWTARGNMEERPDPKAMLANCLTILDEAKGHCVSAEFPPVIMCEKCRQTWRVGEAGLPVGPDVDCPEQPA